MSKKVRKGDWQKDELKELQDRFSKYEKLVFDNRMQFNQRARESEELQNAINDENIKLRKLKRKQRRFANETKIKDSEDDSEQLQAMQSQQMKVRKLCGQIVDQFLQDIRTPQDKYERGILGQIPQQGENEEDRKSLEQEKEQQYINEEQEKEDQGATKNKAVIQICFNSKIARFNVNDPNLKHPFTFKELSYKAAQFFSLPAEQIFFQNEQKSQIYLPQMLVKKSLFPLGSANIVGYFPKVYVTLQRGHSTERFILRDITEDISGKKGDAPLSAEEQLLQKREKEEIARKKRDEAEAQQEAQNQKIQKEQKMRMLGKFFYSLILVITFLGLYSCFIMSGDAHQHVQRQFELKTQTQFILQNLLKANQKSTFYTQLRNVAGNLTDAGNYYSNTGSTLRTPYVRLGVDLAQLGTCTYQSSQSPDGCKQSGQATVHPKVEDGSVDPNTLSPCGVAFTYRKSSASRPFPLMGRFRSYDVDGFYIDIPMSPGTTDYQNYITCLDDNGWIDDRQMRAVIMMYNLVDPSTSIVKQVEIVWESPVLGRLFSKIIFKYMQVNLYKHPQIIGLQVALLVLTLLLIGLSIGKLRESYADLDYVSKKLLEKGPSFRQDILKFQREKKKECRKPHGSQIFNFFTLSLVLFCSLVRVIFDSTLSNDIKLTEQHYVDLSYYSLFYTLMTGLEQTTIFFLSCALFSYLHWIPQIEFFLIAQKRLFQHSFFATLALLLGLTVIFSVVLYLAFGTYSLEYSSYNGALVKTMLLFFKGGVLSPSHTPLGSMIEDSETVIYRFGIFTFFLLVIIIDILIRYIFFNLIVAELINEYNKVHEEQRQERVNKDILQKDMARDNLRKLKMGQLHLKKK